MNPEPDAIWSVRRARLAPSVARLGVALFWLGILVAAALEPGYIWRNDYVSSLASRGSTVAPIGMAAIASMGVAFIAGGFEAQRAWGRRALSIPTALSGAAVLVVAAFRTNCPGGAAGCGTSSGDAARDWIHAVHGYGVALNELFLLLAMAVASIALLMRTGGVDNGLYQRLWVAVNAAWLLLMVGAAARVPAAPAD